MTDIERQIELDIISMQNLVRDRMRKIMVEGAKKHGLDTWKELKGLNHKENAASVFRHIAEFSVDPAAWNPEEKCYHIENAITRLHMVLYRLHRGDY